jgi:energy-coupling factor transporter ATP-binding protein EcfA2
MEDAMEEIYLDKNIKHDMLKMMDKIDDLEQKIINVNTKLKWVSMIVKKLEMCKENEKSKYGI